MNKNIISALIVLSALPFLYLFTQIEVVGNFWYALGNIFGFLGAVLLFWQMFLGIRAFVSNFTDDYGWSLRVHTVLGINGALFVLAHPIIEMLVYQKSIDFLFLSSFDSDFSTRLNFGRIALLLFLLVWFSSSILRNKLNYKVWLNIHYLSYPLMFFVFIHALNIGSFLNEFKFIQFYWFTLVGLFFVMLLFKLQEVFNVGNHTYTLIDKKECSGGIWVYKFKPDSLKIIPKVGQYFYLKQNMFSRSHPFTVMEIDDASGVLSFGIKVFGDFTTKLTKLEVGNKIFISGPYGNFTAEGQNNLPKVIFSGGIGVTPFVELVRRYGDDNTYMLNSNQDIHCAVFRDEFKGKLGERYFDILNSQSQEKNAFTGLVSAEIVEKVIPTKILNEAKFFICGPSGFMKAVTKILTDKGVSKNRIFIEEFSY